MNKSLSYNKQAEYLLFLNVFSIEPCSNDGAEGERGPRNAKPKFAECSKKPPLKGGSLTGFDCAYSIRSDFIKAAGPGRFIRPCDAAFCRFMSNLYILYKISQSRAVQTVQRAIRCFLQQFEAFSHNIDTQCEKQVKLPSSRRAAVASCGVFTDALEFFRIARSSRKKRDFPRLFVQPAVPRLDFRRSSKIMDNPSNFSSFFLFFRMI